MVQFITLAVRQPPGSPLVPTPRAAVAGPGVVEVFAAHELTKDHAGHLWERLSEITTWCIYGSFMVNTWLMYG